MQNSVRGKAFVLGDNIDTDQIIPAELLSNDPSNPQERKEFGRKALSGVPEEASGLPSGRQPFVQPGKEKSQYAVIIGGKNFGCGSSREHAPLAIAEAGCHFVVAESYARIFYRNSINGGYLLPLECDERMSDKIQTGDEVELDVAASVLRDPARGVEFKIKGLGDAGEIATAGGIFEHARKKGLL